MIFSAYDYVVKAKGKEKISTDLEIIVPDGCYGRIAPRSGLAWKSFIDVGAGVIDRDFRGNVCVVLFNFGETDFKGTFYDRKEIIICFVVSKGDRIAQLICEKIDYPELIEVDNTESSSRGRKGFGSSDIYREDTV